MSSHSGLSTHTQSPLAYLPVSLFALVMGLGGWTLATVKAQQIWAWDWGQQVSKLLWVLTVLVFVGLVVLYALKVWRYSDAVAAEWSHPIRLAFFPAISIGLLLIATATAGVFPMGHSFAQGLWLLGAFMHLVFTLAIISRWMHKDGYQIAHANPAWFIPVVGNIVAPLGGVELGFIELSWFYFSIGLTMWLPMLAVVLNRLFFHPAMPQKLLPTLFILLAPPTLGMLSWVKLHGGAVDEMARVLYYFALFTALLLFTQVRYFWRLPFALPWWALSFPLAAFTTATMVMAQQSSTPFLHILSLLLYLFLVLVMLVLVYKTVLATWRGQICVPE